MCERTPAREIRVAGDEGDRRASVYFFIALLTSGARVFFLLLRRRCSTSCAPAFRYNNPGASIFTREDEREKNGPSSFMPVTLISRRPLRARPRSGSRRPERKAPRHLGLFSFRSRIARNYIIADARSDTRHCFCGVSYGPFESRPSVRRSPGIVAARCDGHPGRSLLSRRSESFEFERHSSVIRAPRRLGRRRRMVESKETRFSSFHFSGRAAINLQRVARFAGEGSLRLALRPANRSARKQRERSV